MKKQMITWALLLGLSATPAALAARSIEQAYVDSYRGRTDTPVPVSVERPIVGNEFAGETVEIKFTVDEEGRPRDVRTDSPAPDELVERVIDAVEQWDFAPLRGADGEPVPAKVMLPVIIRRSLR